MARLPPNPSPRIRLVRSPASGSGTASAIAMRAMKPPRLAAAGAGLVTHLFNGMSPFTGRSPVMAGSALNTGRPSLCGADRRRLPRRHRRHQTGTTGGQERSGKIFLVTDAMPTVGTDIIELVLNAAGSGGQRQLTLDDGTLAGADVDMTTSVRIMHTRAGVSNWAKRCVWPRSIPRKRSAEKTRAVWPPGIPPTSSGSTMHWIPAGPGSTGKARRPLFSPFHAVSYFPDAMSTFKAGGG